MSKTVFLKEPILYINQLPGQVTDQDIISLLNECLRVRLNIQRGDGQQQLTGTIEFDKLDNAEKAYATLHNCYLSQYDCYLRLSHSQDPANDPKPSARVRLIKFLPPDASPGRLFSIFRPFGPIYRVALNYHHTPDGLPFFSGTAVIEFYTESQAILAQSEMHCSELDRHTIAVEEYDDRRDRSGRGMAIINTPQQSTWAQATPFVPITSPSGIGPTSSSSEINQRRTSESLSSDAHHQQPVSRWANAQNQQQPYLLNPNSSSSTSPATSKWASPQTPHQQQHHHHQQTSGPTSPDPSVTTIGLGPPQSSQKQVDPCNLFIKGLGPEVESGDLFHAFKQFGTIVSARVMKNEATGISKQFGFVSFTSEESASNALQQMDNSVIGHSNHRIVVRLHELKKNKDGRNSKLVTTLSTPTPTVDSSEIIHHQENGSLLSKLKATDSSVDESPSSVLPSKTEETKTISVEIPEPRTTDPSRLSSTTNNNHSRCGSPSSTQSQGISSSTVAMTERERMSSAVGKLHDLKNSTNDIEELIDLLMALPLRERKLCLFNPQVLASKVIEAKEILDIPDDPTPIGEAARTNVHPSGADSNNSHTTSQVSRGKSTGSSSKEDIPPPIKIPTSSPPKSAPEYTEISTLTKLPIKEILEILLNHPDRVTPSLYKSITSIPDPETFKLKQKEIENWLDNKIFTLTSVHQQKQKIGERLFKILKGFGSLKSVPKVTVDLLDHNDLRALAMVMSLFPLMLKEKVLSSSS
ncbi:hypothetical protein MJO28_003257 [Puccinia striiformis f. sp. tritici]|uniref:Uncharacterized protein n=1 Tax=Puccinia striiformis f. sp. tritici TaxID=168172 RepID=A0ACC0ETX6_9BASI|nr:hypothetical protein MJO28_003257 [Puccinia striiformis f. sp. tritici]